MAHPRLADFIRDNMESILQAWEDFARTIEPPALTMSDAELRDHASQMLLAIADDLDTVQSSEERNAKSKGKGEHGRTRTAAEIHASARLQSGYTVAQLVSEYRALRCSVLALWSLDPKCGHTKNMADLTRFNEGVDQALAESVARYQYLVEQSQNMFLAILGHDLRNPLGTLVSGAGFVMQGADVPPKYVIAATRMYASAKRMGNLVNDLIDFTRTHLGKAMPIRRSPGDFVAVCEQVVNELRTFHPQRVITLNAPPKLDAAVDGDRIAQMLSNLVGNALQYSSEDYPVRVSVGSDDDSVIVTVNNRGAAIAPDKLARIFDPLVRATDGANNDAMERTSLGIGLFIARQIAHAHCGQIDVASNAAEGTTFTVTLLRQPPKDSVCEEGTSAGKS